MRKLRSTTKSICGALVVSALTMLGLTSSASAYPGEFERFNYCPVANPEVTKCFISVATGGMSVIGTAPPLSHVNPITIQGGFTKEVNGASGFAAPTNGVTISKSPQPIPGGLIGILSAGRPATINNPLIRRLAESSINRVFATIELARPASEINVSQSNLGRQEGTAVQLPVKIHLENPFLGKSCFIGSSSSPIVFNLTTDVTSPPPPNQPIAGTLGQAQFLEEGLILRMTENVLVDNAWSAPAAKGCGGMLSFLVDPIINRQLGLPSPAGRNTVVLQSTIHLTTAAALNLFK